MIQAVAIRNYIYLLGIHLWTLNPDSSSQGLCELVFGRWLFPSCSTLLRSAEVCPSPGDACPVENLTPVRFEEWAPQAGCLVIRESCYLGRNRRIVGVTLSFGVGVAWAWSIEHLINQLTNIYLAWPSAVP